MPENNGAPDAAGGIRAGDVSGAMVVGNGNTVSNVRFTAEYGASVTVYSGPLPHPVKRRPISQLPRSAAEPLIGRERDVHVLQEAIATRQLVQVWGASGVGKSALLRLLACTMAHGPDGAAYIEAGGRTADDIAQAIFDISFDAPNYKPSPEVLKEHLKTLRLRIYLDDAGLGEKDLRRLFDMAGQSTFVFTAQRRSAVDDVHAIQLEGLTAPAAVELVAALLPRELRPDEAPIVDALCDAVDGNPLRLRRIALSAATGKGLPGIADLPELLPALLNRLRPQERDLLYLLGSLPGAELAARHLNDLLGLPDTDALAGGLVRHGLLLASETGYSCPPDVAECVLNMRKTVFPADRLCRALTAWVEARDTTPDDVAAHFQALDVAVLRAEKSGHAQLGAALARAASPKLALSRQFDAWGSLLGVGWAAAKSAGDEQGEEFFLREARTRRRALGRAAQTTALVLEAEVLWRELTALHAHSAAHQVTNAASATAPPITTPPVHPVTPTHGAVHTQAITHSTASTSTASAPAHTALPAHAARPVVDLSHASAASAQPHAAAHAAGVHSAVPAPPRIDFSAAHSSVTPPTHAVSTTTTTASAGHTGVAGAGAVGVKTGISGLALACTLGLAAVLGVGAMVYANDQTNASPAVASSPISTPGPDDSTSPTPTVDPVCATVIPDLTSEIQQFNTDAAIASDAVDSYNSDMNAYNSGETSTAPDDSTLLSYVSTVISDLNSVESTLQGAVSQAQDSSVVSDLDDMLTATQQIASLYQSYENDPRGSAVDTSSQSSSMNSAADSLQTDCGA
ncbi:ATP-binding protein [Streptomyces sp. GbtcB6]|uniref:ATP-binding protein n=1 Tax=Streptomyces sp. GbtcB6 TaxID=2824751 RepID=UPI001C2FD108|nr:ATP-binding protein [Streptomyces sp. GbtcB6]